MSTPTPDQGIVEPVGTDPANNPSAFISQIGGIEPRLVRRYTNLADRVARDLAPGINGVTGLATEARLDAYDGASYISLTSRGRYARRMRTTNAAAINNSTTLVNDGVLVVTLDVTGTFSFRGRLYYDSSAVADIKMALTFPAVAASGAKWGLLGRNATTQTNIDAIVATASGTALAAGGNGVGTETFFDFEGFITTTATGSLQVQYAQNALDATNTTVRFGSFLEVIKEG
jgi:hypothetical protein